MGIGGITYFCSMIVQYIVVAVVLGACAVWLGVYFRREWRENVRYKNYGCAGCAFYEKCRRTKKQTLTDGDEGQRRGVTLDAHERAKDARRG